MTRAFLLLTGLALTGCQRDGVSEKAGQDADRAIGIHDSPLKDGPGEKAGRRIDKAMREDARAARVAHERGED